MRNLGPPRGPVGLITEQRDLLNLLRGAAEELAGAVDFEAVVVEQLPDLQDFLDVARAVAPVAGAVLLRAQGRELLLPVAQDVAFTPLYSATSRML